MYTSVMSASMQGLEAVLVQVEVDVRCRSSFIVQNPYVQSEELRSGACSC